MPILRYVGNVVDIQVVGYGHFNHGDAKPVDFITAAAFRDPRCAEEGWVVVDDAPAAVVKDVQVKAQKTE